MAGQWDYDDYEESPRPRRPTNQPRPDDEKHPYHVGYSGNLAHEPHPLRRDLPAGETACSEKCAWKHAAANGINMEAAEPWVNHNFMGGVNVLTSDGEHNKGVNCDIWRYPDHQVDEVRDRMKKYNHPCPTCGDDV